MAGPAAAIIPAAGSGSRMNSAIPKQFLILAGKPVLVHTVSAFISCRDVSQIIVVVPEGWQAEAELLLDRYRDSGKKNRRYCRRPAEAGFCFGRTGNG